MGTLFTKINDDLTAAVKNKDAVAVSTLRFLLAGIHNAKIAKGEELTDAEVLDSIFKEAKRHSESIEAYKKAQREELVKKEEAELVVLKKYLPEPLSDKELENMVDEAIAAVGAASMADLGKVISTVTSATRAKGEGAKIARIAGEKLSSPK